MTTVLIVPAAARASGTAGVAASPLPGVSAAAMARASRGVVHQGHATGHRVRATYLAHPPKITAAQAAALKADEASASHQVVLGRPGNTRTAPPPNPPLSPRPAATRDGVTSAATLAGEASILRDSTLPAISGENTSTVEPSTDANGGSNIFETGNIFAAWSANSGTTWTYLNLIGQFGFGVICCDQVTQFDPTTGNEFWIAQTSTGALDFSFASANGTHPYSNWCTWNFTPASIGITGSAKFDLPIITVASGSIWFGSDITGSTTGADVIGIPKSYLTSCSSITYYWVIRTDNQKFMFANGSTGTMYWATDTGTGMSNGTTFRIYAWVLGGQYYYWWNYTGTASTWAFSYETTNSGQNCASIDGEVNNWCQFADSSVDGGYLANGWLGFSFNAKQDNSHAEPYTRILAFQLSNMAYSAKADIYNGDSPMQYAAMAPSLNGLVGVEFTFEDANEGLLPYPSMGFDAFDPSLQSFDDTLFFPDVPGGGNACKVGGTNGIARWGDYLTVHAYYGNANDFIAAGFVITGGDCGTSGASAQVHNVLFTG